MNYFINAMSSPWKVYLELLQYILKPFMKIYLNLSGISVKDGYKFYGLPSIMRSTGSSIIIGRNFENRNWWNSNPLGINHPTIIATWSSNAKIKIGNDVGISGGSICAQSSIEIGDGTLIGANCTIIDTDFHPIKSKSRRYDKTNIRTAPIKIGKNVFIGTGVIILKGVNIGDNVVIPAGAVVR